MNTLKLAIQPRSWTLALCLCLAPFAMSAAQAGIFSDNEARQAILDLRSEVKAQGDSKNAEIAKLMEQTEGLHRSLLSLQNQIEELKQSNSQQTGKIEELQKQLQDAKALPTAAASTSEAVGIDISSAAAQTQAPPAGRPRRPCGLSAGSGRRAWSTSTAQTSPSSPR